MDPIVTDALPADSSPAAVSSPDPSDPLDALSAEDLHTWRMTGDLPDSTTTADSSSATAVQDPPASTDATPPAASEPAKATPGADKRIPELLADRAKERERADRAERRLAELQRQPPADARPAAPSPATAGKPDPEKFTYGTSDPDYLEALADYKYTANAARDRASWEEGQRQTRVRDEAARVVTAFETKAEAARTKYPDFDAVALQAPTEIQPGSAADLWVLEDEAGADILYHLQQPTHAAERRRILALGPREQLKELVRLGDRLTAALPAGRSTHAPPPAPHLGSRATPADAVERALADGDSDEATGRWIAEENRRELARLTKR